MTMTTRNQTGTSTGLLPQSKPGCDTALYRSEEVIYCRAKPDKDSLEDQEEANNRIREIVNGHLSFVPDLSARIRAIMWTRIESLLELAER